MNEIPQPILDIYFWYKIGEGCAVFCAIFVGLFLLGSLGIIACADEQEKIGKPFLIIAALCFLCLIPASIVAVITPDREDFKAAALLIIGQQAANSEEAQRLIHAVTTYLEKQ